MAADFQDVSGLACSESERKRKRNAGCGRCGARSGLKWNDKVGFLKWFLLVPSDGWISFGLREAPFEASAKEQR